MSQSKKANQECFGQGCFGQGYFGMNVQIGIDAGSRLGQSGFEDCRKLGHALKAWQSEIARMWRFSGSVQCCRTLDFCWAAAEQCSGGGVGDVVVLQSLHVEIAFGGPLRAGDMAQARGRQVQGRVAVWESADDLGAPLDLARGMRSIDNVRFFCTIEN